MTTTHPGQHAPFDVAIGYHPIVDHRFVHPGRAQWMDDRGIHHGAWGLERPTEVRPRTWASRTASSLGPSPDRALDRC